MSAWSCRSIDGKADQKIVPPRLRIPYWKGLGADSEEKHEPASDIDTALMDGLKALDPKRPIREADIQNLACAGAVTPAALISPSSPAGVVTEQLGLNIDGYLLDRPICRRPREHSRP